MNSENGPKKPVAGYAPVPATGPLAGTPNDFRVLFPGLVRPAVTLPKGVRSSRRSFFRVIAPKKAKP